MRRRRGGRRCRPGEAVRTSSPDDAKLRALVDAHGVRATAFVERADVRAYEIAPESDDEVHEISRALFFEGVRFALRDEAAGDREVLALMEQVWAIEEVIVDGS